MISKDHARPKVLIRTRPPNRNPNYGGILQAWALQRTLDRLGFDARVDSTQAPLRRRQSSFVNTVKRIAVRLTPSSLVPKAWTHQELRYAMGGPLLTFAPERIPMAPVLDDRAAPIPETLAEFDAFVVGSDQVWRPEYVNVCSNMFDFLDEEDKRPRLSYAASFGTATPNFPPEQFKRLGELSRQLTAVSVRESAGVKVCLDYWGVDAEQHVDPTFLIALADYRSLATEARDAFPEGQFVDYILDSGAESQRTVSDVSRILSTTPLQLTPPTPSSYHQFRRDKKKYQRHSVEAWLGAITSSRYVVTDSFHGTVFAILSNTPFLAVVNHSRGASRFESLLETFGLEDRLVEAGSSLTREIVLADIDWQSVSERIQSEQTRSIDYLQRALEPTWSLALARRRH